MNKKKMLLLASATLLLVLVTASILYRQLSGNVNSSNLVEEHSGSTEQHEMENTEKMLPPDFIVLDASGKEVKLSDFHGKPTVVSFWASWCGACKSHMPAFDAVFQRMGNDIHFLMVNMTDGSRETLDIAKAFVADSGYGFPVYYDTQYSAMTAYGVYSLPTTYFFDAEGYGVAYAIGAINEDAILRGISMITT